MSHNTPEPNLPVAEVELLYRPKKHDDWGMIRTSDGELFAIVRRPIDNEEADRHRSAKTDPFEPLARRLMATFATPIPDTSAGEREMVQQSIATKQSTDATGNSASETATEAERERCAAIVQMARFGEIDQDFRAIISIIEGGMTIEQIKEFCT